MEGISDLKICGLDEMRPPRIRKEPYIDLYFQLSHKAPEDWCNDFNNLTKQLQPPAKIAPATGLFVETWVRKPEEIEPRLKLLQDIITDCSEKYIARIHAQAAAQQVPGKSEDEGEQGRLNQIIAGLDFDT